MGKKTTNHGTGKFGVAIEGVDYISNNWFESEKLRDINYNRVKDTGGVKVSKVKRWRG